MALETSYEQPAPVRVVAQSLLGYVDRLGPIWVDGQVAELTRRPTTVFLTLRDPLADVSLRVTCPRATFDSLTHPVTEGSRVVVQGRFRYYVPRGTLSLAAVQIRPVGVGELLARLEQRRQLLAAEGLFDSERKRSLPFLPGVVGLIAGRESAAERDVLENARKRWPGVAFRVEHCLVQGVDAARQVIEALGVLERDPAVEVIVIARGGGSLEDLLPFSDEGLLRAVAACTTPVVSAIGHEQDQPLLDLVADLRASTPTDAAKQVVPDVREELARVRQARSRCRTALRTLIAQQLHGLDTMRSRPVLAQPHRMYAEQEQRVRELRDRARRCLAQRLDASTGELTQRLAHVRGLSPLATLQRGYTVLQDAHGHVVTDSGAVSVGDTLTARLATGRLHVAVADTIAEED